MVTWLADALLPQTGGRLPSEGVRVLGRPVPADAAAPDAVLRQLRATGLDRNSIVYAPTGTATQPQGGLPSDGLGECVLTVGRDRFQVQWQGRAADVVEGARVTVTGELFVVPDYEWEAFELPDTRADWTVRDVTRPVPYGDVWVDLVGAEGPVPA